MATMNRSNTTTGRSTVVGVFHDRARAEEAVRELERIGFGADHIGFVTRDEPAGSTGTSGQMQDSGSNAGAGALAGAATGGVLGGILGAAAALLIPGVGPVLAAGILGPVLGGAAAGAALGAVGGGIVGALINAGIPEEEAHYYDEQFRAGRTIVTVRADGRFEEAQRVLREYGAYDIESRNSAAQTGAASPTSASTRRDEKTLRVPEIEERLEVEKRPAAMGEVQLQKHVTEQQQTIPVELEHEEVHVERREVSPRPLREDEKPTFEESTVRVPVYGERAVVRKEPVVTGEVVVHKEPVTERQEIADTVRRTEVQVDQSRAAASGGAIRWEDAASHYRGMWQQRYGSRGGTWEDYEPAYRYGHEMRADPRFSGRRWEEVETELQRDWGKRYSGSPWERYKVNVREAWEAF